MFMALAMRVVVSTRVLTLVIYFVILLAIYYLANQQKPSLHLTKYSQNSKMNSHIEKVRFYFLRFKPKIK